MSRDIVNGAYRFDYLETQRSVLDTVAAQEATDLCYCGGFGSGKTRMLGEIALETCIAYPGCKGGVFRKTRVSVRDTTYNVFTESVMPPEYIHEWRKDTLEFTLRNRAHLQFFGIDNFERKASLQFDFILIDEALELDEQDFVMLSGRLRGVVLYLPFMLSVCNAGNPGHYLHEKFVKNAEKPEHLQDKDFRYFCASSYENTHNPPSYFKRLEKWKGTKYFDRYVLSKWVAYAGGVFEIDPTVHVIAPFEIPGHWQRGIAVDFGFDHAHVTLWIAFDPISKTYYVYRQFYKTRTLVKKIVEICKSVTERCKEVLSAKYGDHDAENRAQWEEYWDTLTPADKAIKSGVQTVNELLIPDDRGRPHLFIFNNDWSERDGFWYGLMEEDPLLIEAKKPHCLQDEMVLLKWGTDDKPQKGDDHGSDAVRYYVHSDRTIGGNELEIYSRPGFSRR